MSKTVVKELDLMNLPPLSDEQSDEVKALAARPDDEIDYSDIARSTEAFWAGARRGRFSDVAETSITLDIDADVLAWLRAQGQDYRSRINAILRREMLSTRKF